MSSYNKRLSLHHIGGREESGAFPHLEKFDRDIVNVLYDADPDCLAQMRAVNKGMDTCAASKKRFEVSSTEEEERRKRDQRQETPERRVPPWRFFLRKVRRQLSRIGRAFDDTGNEKYSEVEEFLLTMGLKEQANILRANRIAQSRFVKASA